MLSIQRVLKHITFPIDPISLHLQVYTISYGHISWSAISTNTCHYIIAKTWVQGSQSFRSGAKASTEFTTIKMGPSSLVITQANILNVAQSFIDLPSKLLRVLLKKRNFCLTKKIPSITCLEWISLLFLIIINKKRLELSLNHNLMNIPHPHLVSGNKKMAGSDECSPNAYCL